MTQCSDEERLARIEADEPPGSAQWAMHHNELAEIALAQVVSHRAEGKLAQPK
jgi:hypothetical protein